MCVCVLTCSLGLHRVPDVTIKVIVTGQQKATAFREGDRCDSANYIIMAVHGQLLVGADIKQTTGGVI